MTAAPPAPTPPGLGPLAGRLQFEERPSTYFFVHEPNLLDSLNFARMSDSTTKKRSAAEEADLALVQSALRKRQAGQPPNRSELAALKRYESQREEEQRWLYYRTIPQKYWRQMSGRQPRQLIDQASRYRLPIGGATIDLTKLIPALHDLLAKHHDKFDDDPLLTGGDSPALERYRDERAKLAKLDRLEREVSLIDRHQVRAVMTQFASLLRGAASDLQKRFGAEAVDIYNEALDEVESIITREWSDEAPDPPPPATAPSPTPGDAKKRRRRDGSTNPPAKR